MMSTEAVEESSSKARRPEILRVAAELFAKEGYQRTTLGDLAQAANMAKATLFHYFATKERILFELYVQAMDVALSRLTGVSRDDDPAVELRHMLREHALVIMENQSLFRIFFGEEAGLEPEHRATVRGQQADYVNLVADRVRRLQRQRRVAKDVHPRVAAQSMLGTGSFTYNWYQPDHSISREEIAEFTAEMALHGLLKKLCG